ncbi:hypothetical protein Emag_007349 [Eimeria magna]
MSSDDHDEKLGPDESLMSLAAEPLRLHEHPPLRLGSPPVPDSDSSADSVLPSLRQQEVPDAKIETSPAADSGSSVASADFDPQEEDDLGLPLREVLGRCPFAWSPPRRKHDRFGFYNGPPLTAENPVERPIPFRQPHCPFGDPAALNPIRYFAVLPGPGYEIQAIEQFRIVKMSLRDVYREVCYDRACCQLYLGRFLRRFSKVFPEPPPPLTNVPYSKLHLSGCFACLVFVPFLSCSSGYQDLPRSNCMTWDKETEKQILEDYDRRWLAFDPLCSDYPRRGKVNDWKDNPHYPDPRLMMVIERTIERPRAARDLRVRFPHEVQRCPHARAYLHRTVYVVDYKHVFLYPTGGIRRWFADPCPL